jgi:hypothetical protein
MARTGCGSHGPVPNATSAPAALSLTSPGHRSPGAANRTAVGVVPGSGAPGKRVPCVQRRARPVLACGKRVVLQQLHPWMIGGHPAWPGLLEPVAADGQTLVLQASDNGLQCCAGPRGRHRRPGSGGSPGCFPAIVVARGRRRSRGCWAHGDSQPWLLTAWSASTPLARSRRRGFHPQRGEATRGWPARSAA